MPSPATTSPKSPVTPLKVWRSKLPDGVNRKDKRAPSSEKKKPLSNNARPSVLGPSIRQTINASAEVASVKNSEFARCTIGNHELKLLQILENTDSADYVAAYEGFRRKILHKDDPLKVAKISRPKKNMAKLKMAVNLIKGNKLTFLSKAQLAFSPLNPDNKKDTTALMKKIRQMKLEAGLEEACPESSQQLRGVDLENSDPIEHDATMDAQKEKEIEKAFRYVVGEFASSPFTSGSLVKSSGEEKKTDKNKKPVHHAMSSSGVKSSASMKELRDKGFIKNAQALRVKKIREEQKQKAEEAFAKKKSATAAAAAAAAATKKKSNNAKHKKKARTYPYPADKYSEHQRMLEAKLPEKLRQECNKKYDKLMEPFSERCSARSWSKIKAKDDVHKEYESLTITGTLGQPFTPSQTQSQAVQSHSSAEPLIRSSEVPESPGDEEEDEEEEVFARLNTTATSPWHRNTDDLISGDAILYPMERDGLFTVDDLEDLSVNSEKSHDMLSNGSEAGLFNTMDLMQLDLDEKDEMLQHEEDVKSPDGALTVSVGALLYSQKLKDEVNTRPAGAGLGGITQSTVHSSSVKPNNKQDLFSYHSKYSIDVNKRPKSANTSAHVRCSSDYEKIDEIPNHVQKKRLVVTRHRAPEVWIT